MREQHLHWLFFILFSNFFLLSFSEQRSYCTKWIRVEEGDSCWKIANSHEISVDTLKSLNPGVNCDELWSGTQLCIISFTTKQECTETYTVASGDFCYKIWTDHELSEVQFMQMNEKLDCAKLESGQKVCTSIDQNLAGTTPEVDLKNSTAGVQDRLSLSLLEDEQSCFEFATFETETDTCETMAVAYNLNLTAIESQFNCSDFKIGDTICVSRNYSCQHRYTIQKGDTCHAISDIFKLNTTEIEEINKDVRCDKLPVGRRICVWSVDERTLPDMRCQAWSQVVKETSCYFLSSSLSIPIDEFKFINPTINCQHNVPEGVRFCTSAYGSPKNCSSIQSGPFGNSCSELAQSLSMSEQLLLKLNPILNCDRLPDYQQVCAGRGLFTPSRCVETLRITPELDECRQIIGTTGLTVDQIQRLNPDIDCQTKLEHGNLVCIKSLGMNTISAQQIVVSHLQNLVPELYKKFENFLNNPSQENTENMNTLMTSAIQKPEVNLRIKELYRIDANFRTIIDNQHPLPREEYCKQARQTSMP